MKTAIRKNLRNFIAIAVLIVVGLRRELHHRPAAAAADPDPRGEALRAQGRLLRRPRRSCPARARRSTSPASRSGEVEDVQLENGVAVGHLRDRPQVPADLQERHDPAAAAHRPEGHVLRARPGHQVRAGVIPDGGTIPLANTAPDVNLDEILSALDGDTHAYLRMLLIGAGQGLKGQGQNLGKLLGSLGPLNRDLDRVNSMVAQRRQNLADLVHNLSVLTEDDRPAHRRRHLVRQRRTTPLSARSAPRTRTCSVPSRCSPRRSRRPRNTFGKVNGLAHELGPAFNALRPFARNLDALNSSLRQTWPSRTPRSSRTRSARSSAPPGRTSPPLHQAAQQLLGATPKLTTLATRSTASATWRPTTRTALRDAPAVSATRSRRQAGPGRGLPVLGVLARARRATRCSRPRTRTASTGASTSRRAARHVQNLLESAPLAGADHAASTRLFQTAMPVSDVSD